MITDVLKTAIELELRHGGKVSSLELLEEAMMPRELIDNILDQGYDKRIVNDRISFENKWSELGISNNQRLSGVYVVTFAAIRFIDPIIYESKKYLLSKTGIITNKSENKIDWDYMTVGSDSRKVYNLAEKISLQYGEKNHSYKDFERFVRKK